MFNLGDMMGRFQDMQKRLKEVKDSLEDIVVEAEAGGGMVRVTANANRRILKMTIDPDVVDKNDTELMADLITAAVNKALDKAEVRGREELERVTKGMMPNIPGLDLSALGLS
ncbi:MAG: YbaB/EbfC family nucleoid-associated protein [Bacteroidia bacterium]|nr:YbaB/EbfC family nucleoid-associated protein [Bacteroidia bacterium]